MTNFLAKIKAFLTTPFFNYARAALYVAIPSALLTLVDEHKLSRDAANIWTGIVLAALSPAIAAIFSPSGLKTYLFTLAAAVQVALVGFGGGNSLWVAVIGSFLTSAIAASNVHSSEAVAARE